MDALAGLAHHVQMQAATISPPHFIREWRKAKGLTLEVVADALKTTHASLSRIERGLQPYSQPMLQGLADLMAVDPADLLGPPDAAGRAAGRGLVRIIGQVGADASGSVIMTTAHDSWDMAPPPPGATSRAVALDVRGDSMHTFAENGALIYFEDQRAPLDPELIGVPCVVETEDGRVLVKRPKRGSQPGLYDLESDFGPVMKDVRLAWAAEVIAVIPPRQARRIIVKASDAA
jgi:transcriptional regulator with XRE-family HTH domain